MIQCTRKGCLAAATHQPKICIPAKDRSRNQPLGIILGLYLCEMHCKRFDVQGFLADPSADGKKTNKDLFQMLTKGAPERDYSRGYVIAVKTKLPELAAHLAQAKNADQPVSPPG